MNITKPSATANKGKKSHGGTSGRAGGGAGAGAGEYKGRMATFKLDRTEQRAVLREQAQAQSRSRKG